MEIAEFLLARIGEDGEAAREMNPGARISASNGAVVFSAARVLAECEAKRRLLQLHEIETVDYTGGWWTDPAPPGTYVATGCTHCTSCGVDGESYVVDGPCPTLRLLALPYADHPDYRAEWKV